MSERKVGIELFQQATARLAKGELPIAARLAARAREVFIAAGDFESACAAATLEGRIQVRAGRPHEARMHFEWAHTEADRRGLLGRALAALTELGALHEGQGDLQAAVALHRQVLAGERQRGDNLGIAVAAGNVGRLLPRLAPGRTLGAGDQDADARNLLEEARARFEAGRHPAGLANALICLCELERGAGDLDAAEAAIVQAEAATRAAGLGALHAVACLNLGHLRRDRADTEGALQAFADAETGAARAGDRLTVARAHLAIAMVRAEIDPLEASEQALSRAEAEFRALGQPGGALVAAVNRAAVVCRLGRLRAGQDLLQEARASLRVQGDRQGVLEVGLALAEVALTRGDPAAAEAELEAAPPAACTGRLGIRRGLLQARVHVRRLQLDAAAAALAALPRRSLSEAERFGIGLAECELWTLRGDPAAGRGLDVLAAQAAQGHSRREAAAVLSAQAHDALHRLGATAAVPTSAAAVAAWQDLGEPLPLAHARAHAARVALLLGRADAAAELPEVEALLRASEAVDAARAVAILRATAALRDHDVTARDRLLADVAGLREHGNALAALMGLLCAAAVVADPDLRARASAALAASGCAAPAWWPENA